MRSFGPIAASSREQNKQQREANRTTLGNVHKPFLHPRLVAAIIQPRKPYFNRKRISTARSTLADVTNLPTIPPGGSQNHYVAM
jgi:hypothetical protein